jgi:hypothetical protein
MKNKRAWLLLAVVLAAWIGVRAPSMGMEGRGAHDWVTLHSLLVVRIWNAAGLEQAHYAPIMNWPNPADRFISYAPGQTVSDEQGNTYYVAFPPLAFLVAWVVQGVLKLEPSALVLRSINLVALIPASLLFYALVRRLFAGERAHALGLIGMVVLLFNRATLVSYGNLYSPLILVFPLWMMTVCAYLGLAGGVLRGRGWPWAFGLLVFLSCYCDWLGFLAALSFCGYSLVAGRLQGTHLRLVATSGGAALLAGALIWVQYAAIGGAGALLSAWGNRLGHRSGLVAGGGRRWTVWDLSTYRGICARYLEQYWPVLLLLAGLGAAYWLSRRAAGSLRRNGELRRAMFCFGAPVALDHVLLSNHTAIHDFAALKAAPVLALIVVWLVEGLWRAERGWLSRKAGRAAVVSALAGMCVLAMVGYWRDRGTVDPGPAQLAGQIRSSAAPHQVVFVVGGRSGPVVPLPLIYLSGRNIQRVRDEGEAREFLRARRWKDGVIFFAGAEWQPSGAPRAIREDGISGSQ